MIFWWAVASAAEPIALQPVLMTELDATAYADPSEGQTGLRVARLQLGAVARITPWLEGFGVAELALREVSPILDAGVRLFPAVWLELTIGYDKTPLFATAHDLPVETTALPDFPLATRALWRGRDLGIEAHLRDRGWPGELYVRVGNGSGTPYGNDDARPSFEARMDLTAGRGRFGAEGDEVRGMRAGGGVHFENAEDRPAIAGETPTGFLFWRPPTVSGPMQLVAVRALGWIGPVSIAAEGGWAHEGRARDDDGNPDTPRIVLDPVSSLGGVGEVAVAVLGPWRTPGAWPSTGTTLPTVEGGGRLWSPRGLALGLFGYRAAYDGPPLETPGRSSTLGARARLTYSLPSSTGVAAGGRAAGLLESRCSSDVSFRSSAVESRLPLRRLRRSQQPRRSRSSSWPSRPRASPTCCRRWQRRGRLGAA